MTTFLKRAGLVVLGLVLILLLAGSFLAWRGGARLSAVHDLAYDPVAVPTDSASIARGRYLVAIHACAECHGDGLGGKIAVDAPPFLIVAPNLTSGAGGIGSTFTDGDWLRALRHGVAPDARGLFLMPSELYNNLSDTEIGAMVAYLKRLPAVDRALPATEFRTLGNVIAGLYPEFRSAAELVGTLGPRPEMPEPGPTAAFGRYRTETLCVVCHGKTLRGGKHPDPDAPPGPDLMVVSGWTREGFGTAMRTGVTPGGRNLDPHYMPWRAFAHMTDEEIDALYAHLQTL